jgi:hypothetical protein
MAVGIEDRNHRENGGENLTAIGFFLTRNLFPIKSILTQTNSAHKAQIEKHFKGEDLNSSYLASAIRHIFAHGKLTPHANTSKPRNVVKICNAISDFLLLLMDTEFSNKVRPATKTRG